MPRLRGTTPSPWRSNDLITVWLPRRWSSRAYWAAGGSSDCGFARPPACAVVVDRRPEGRTAGNAACRGGGGETLGACWRSREKTAHDRSRCWPPAIDAALNRWLSLGTSSRLVTLIVTAGVQRYSTPMASRSPPASWRSGCRLRLSDRCPDLSPGVWQRRFSRRPWLYAHR